MFSAPATNGEEDGDVSLIREEYVVQDINHATAMSVSQMHYLQHDCEAIYNLHYILIISVCTMHTNNQHGETHHTDKFYTFLGKFCLLKLFGFCVTTIIWILSTLL